MKTLTTNTRLAYIHEGATINKVQETHYYPFGHLEQSGNPAISGRISPLSNQPVNLGTERNNAFLYNGKEFNDDFGLNWGVYPVSYGNYGARFYDAQIGRFHTIDPRANDFPWQSPYVYADNNPVNFIDFNGESAQRLDDEPQASISRKDLTQVQQLKAELLIARKNEIATTILSNQGVTVNSNTVGAASETLNMTATYSEKPTMGANGPRVDGPKALQIESLTLTGLNLPGETSNTARNREVAVTITGEVINQGAQMGAQKAVNLTTKALNTGKVLIGGPVNFVGFVLSPVETGMGASPASGEKARVSMEQQQARQAIIIWYNELINQNQ